MYLKLNGIEFQAEPQDRWLDLIDGLPDGGEGALGVAVNGCTRALTEPVEEYAFARLLTYDDEEGRRIYERSLQLLFLAAVRSAYPEARVRIEHSFGQGLFIRVENPALDIARIQAVERGMRTLADMDLPLVRKRVSTQEAKTYFERTGQTDRLRILNYRRFDYFTLYELAGCEDYFYGEMVPSTGYLQAFSLVPYADGLVLMQPDRRDPSRPATFRDLPKLMRVYEESARWQSILGVENAADLNEMIEEHRLREFIRVNEALQERRIQEIADQFIDSGARLMLIAGPSSSGKTTFAHRLSIALRVHGLRPVKLSLDDYYRNRDTLPREADGSIDLERIDTLDVELLNEHLPLLLAGETVELPEYDFKTGMRAPRTHAMQVEEGQPIIIEGIHGLNDALTANVPRDMKFKIYISALTMLNLDDHNRIRTTDARLLRRIVRDNLFRGTLPEETMGMWASVRRGEERYIFPFQEEADAMFNSSLSYELPIMRSHAYPLLMAVQPESPYYTLARRLVKFLNYIRPADVEDEIPVNSILREFIGGCCFYREED
ncbi:MAG: nucleoside kinase [Clostridia bacterium]|nr:nucleoside kinase [Clostridia bacterium]